MGPRAGLDRCRKSRLHRDSIPGPYSPQRVAIPTEISRSPNSKVETGIAQSSEMFRNSAPFSGNGKHFSIIHGLQTRLRYKQPLIQWALQALSQGLKQSGREADHSLHSSAEDENIWSYTSTPKTRMYSLKRDGIAVCKLQ